MASTWGNFFKISIFGESHGNGIGVVIDGLPAGLELDQSELLAFMARRAPGNTPGSTARREADVPEILSGFFQGVSTGTPLTALIRNSDTHSKDYGDLVTTARPGHADYTGYLRYRGHNDYRGGGHFSGRLTAPLCFAGAVAKQFLKRHNITVGAHALRVHDISDIPFPSVHLNESTLEQAEKAAFPTLDPQAGQKMADAIEQARGRCDSLGGVVECAVTGFPAGIGSPMFDGLENRIASITFGIPAVKGLEFGDGFAASLSCGSENNDAFCIDGEAVRTKSNHAGGILGGISNGMPILLRAAFKPTPSIACEQQTVDFAARKERTLSIHGRHDPCVVIRAVPVVESAVAIALADALIEADGYRH